jgi:hypothetical protein
MAWVSWIWCWLPYVAWVHLFPLWIIAPRITTTINLVVFFDYLAVFQSSIFRRSARFIQLSNHDFRLFFVRVFDFDLSVSHFADFFR